MSFVQKTQSSKKIEQKPRETSELGMALEQAQEDGFVTEYEASSCKAYLTINKDPAKCFFGTDKESNMFSAFLMGRTFAQIARNASCPVEMIILTAIKHRWDTKAQVMANAGDTSVVEHLTKNLANYILEINLAAIDKEMNDIYTGKKDPRDSIFSAKTPQELQKLLQIVMQANGLKNSLASSSSTGPAVNINNQIANVQQPQQNTTQVTATETETVEALSEPSRLEQLKMIRDSESVVPNKKEE